MPKKSKNKELDDLANAIGCIVAIPIIAFFAFWILFSGGKSKPKESQPTRVAYTPPTPKELASKKCRKAVEDKYAEFGYDVVRLASQRITMSEREDGTYFTSISVPFKTVDRITGKRNRVFWINTECTVDGNAPAVIVEKDTVGYPG